MNIKTLYRKFGITPNLAQHMLIVAGVVLFIRDHWIGEILDWESLRKAALLHDVGNVVKFDLDKYPELLGEEKANLDYWKQIQKQTINKYGNDDHEATKKMLNEVGVDKKIIEIIIQKSFGNSKQTAASKDWYSKILLYSDLRVLTAGVATMQERFKDIKERMPKYVNRPDFRELLKACEDIESQIQENLDVSVSEINNELASETEKLLGINI